MFYNYQQNKDGLYIGYHVEGGETSSLSGYPSLSLNSLVDERPFFISENKDDWWPHHLPQEDYTLYEVLFEPPKSMWSTPDWDVYQSWFITRELDNGQIKTELSQAGKELNVEFYNLSKDNYHRLPNGMYVYNELQESFFIRPTKWIKEINAITSIIQRPKTRSS